MRRELSNKPTSEYWLAVLSRLLKDVPRAERQSITVPAALMGRVVPPCLRTNKIDSRR